MRSTSLRFYIDRSIDPVYALGHAGIWLFVMLVRWQNSAVALFSERMRTVVSGGRVTRLRVGDVDMRVECGEGKVCASHRAAKSRVG